MLVSPALAPDALYDGGAAEPDGVALGDPPVKQPPTPGLIALASTLLAATFDLAEQVPQDA
jgi:hypothetical protein